MSPAQYLLTVAFANICVGGLAVTHKGEFTFTTLGRVHRVNYDVDQTDNASVIELKSFSQELLKTTCNLDASAVLLSFKSAEGANAFKMRVDQARHTSGIDVFLVGHNEQGCAFMNGSTHNFLFRRVLTDPALYRSDTTQILVKTAVANYGDVYSNAIVSYTSRPSEADWHLCLGVNADPSSCDSAKEPISLYQKDALSVTCDSCFAGFRSDVFFDLNISWFRLRSVEGGFKRMSVNADFDLDMNVNYQKSLLALDKTLFSAGGKDHPILSFDIAGIPFVLWFESSLKTTAELDFSAAADAKAGISMVYDIGDNYIQWQEGKGWSHVKPTPKLTVKPSVSGSASFDLTGSFTLPASLSLHVNQVFSQTAELSPIFDVAVHGDVESKQICITGDYDNKLTTRGNLHMSILFNLVSLDANLPEETLWSVHKGLPKTCLPKPGGLVVV